MIIPYGLEDARIRRLPVVSIAIVVLCVGIFFPSYVFAPNVDAQVEQHSMDVYDYWQRHPYLVLPRELGTHVSQAEQKQLLVFHEKPAPEIVAQEQAQLDALFKRIQHSIEKSVFYRWGLVPQKGLFQRGWLTHIFLHAGWMHLIGNMFFFFFLVGPFLEDVWGRVFFTLFFLVGGVLAAVPEVLLSSRPEIPNIGASGAISACVGAFCWRFAKRKVKFAYWFSFFFTGTLRLPAWAWAFFYFGSDLFYYLMVGSSSGVAYLIHLGGFAAGMGVAVLVHSYDLEQTLIKTQLDAELGVYTGDPELEEADAAVSRGDYGAAEKLYHNMLAKDERSVNGLSGLTRLALAQNDAQNACKWFERLMLRSPVVEDAEMQGLFYDELGSRLAVEHCSTSGVLRLAQQADALARYPQAAVLYAASSTASAQVRAAELYVNELRDSAMALHYAHQAQHSLGANAEILERVRAVITAAELRQGVLLHDANAVTPLASPGAQQSLLYCKIVGRDATGLRVKSILGQEFILQPQQIAGISAALVEKFEVNQHVYTEQVVTDVLLQASVHTATHVRFFSEHMGLENLSSDGQVSYASYLDLLRELCSASQCRLLLVDASLWQGTALPRFATMSEFEQAYQALLAV